MDKEFALNILIKGCDTNRISDGYHTFGELYEHRIQLFIALCRVLSRDEDGFDIWRSSKHHDGTSFDGWFIMGIGQKASGQISYHLPIIKWSQTEFAETLEKAPEFDGHTSADVLYRLTSL